MFSPHNYTHFTSGWELACVGMFIATFAGVVGVVRATYPDKPSVDRGYEDGLFEELGGEGALHVSTCSV